MFIGKNLSRRAAVRQSMNIMIRKDHKLEVTKTKKGYSMTEIHVKCKKCGYESQIEYSHDRWTYAYGDLLIYSCYGQEQ